MLNARKQAQDYAHALPEWPPFILVCDVGNVIEVYADFSGLGKNYNQFPDRESFRPSGRFARSRNPRGNQFACA